MSEQHELTDITDLDIYQQEANRFINRRTNSTQREMLTNAAFGLAGETGEFTDLLKKIYFHEHPFTEVEAQKLVMELGDVLWYIAQAATALGTSFSTIASLNIAKLESRHGLNGFSVSASMAKEAAKDFTAPLRETLNEAMGTRIAEPLLRCECKLLNDGVKDVTNCPVHRFGGFTLREKR